MTNTDLCHAPCVVNAGGNYNLFTCELPRGHAGECMRKIKGTKDSFGGHDAVLNWTYTGKCCPGAMSSAPSVDERCRSHQVPARVIQLTPSNPDRLRILLYMWQKDQAEATDGYMCELKPGHDGAHQRRGEFMPLGMKWTVTWSSEKK